MTENTTLYPGSTHSIPLRQVDFDFKQDIPRYWFKNNPVVTHGFNGFNLIIPEYERIFVRSVMRLRSCSHDPILRQQIKGFAAQEMKHANVHEAYFVWLKQQGYHIERFLRLLKKYVAFSERMGSPSFNLASTAAAEHYTATIATLFLSEPHFASAMNPTMKKFLTWHSAEEIEHKAVAFDLMQAADIGYFTRIVAYMVVSIDIFVWVTIAIFMLTRQDKLSLWKLYHFKRIFQKESNGITKRFRSLLFAYFRKNFHPNDIGDLTAAHEQLRAVGINAKPVANKSP